jgi:hypothetical protein
VRCVITCPIHIRAQNGFCGQFFRRNSASNIGRTHGEFCPTTEPADRALTASEKTPARSTIPLCSTTRFLLCFWLHSGCRLLHSVATRVKSAPLLQTVLSSLRTVADTDFLSKKPILSPYMYGADSGNAGRSYFVFPKENEIRSFASACPSGRGTRDQYRASGMDLA